ncbi:hypothetical protein GCM10011506_35620 [Marivirga lumbricoides]|uniref:Uncharacterized protein n=1 Tax=Marivirga lumbricoides TaxID=1046115 RepID=A0ABQ1MTT2_9BACT|nr:hypothetical protein GCM10011506_35620 [Marivirga lumbricoides]
MIDLSFQYRPLLKVDIQHEYFVEQPAKNLQFIPLQKSLNVINKLGLLLKSSERGFELLIDHRRKDALKMILTSEEHISLDFWMISTNPYFNNITKSSDLSLNTIFSFQNKKANVEKVTSLHKKEYASEADLVYLSDNEISLNNTSGIKVLEIKDEENTVVERLENLSASHKFIPKSLSEGLYKIFAEGKEIANFVSLPYKRPKYPAAFINLFLNSTMKEEIIQSIDEGLPIPQFDFVIAFNARETYWRYMLVSKYIKGLEKSVILQDNKKADFKGPMEMKLPNGQVAQMFESSNPLKLFEFSPHAFQLTRKNGQLNATEKILMKRLPIPAIDSLRSQQDKNNNNFFSDIIVYL